MTKTADRRDRVGTDNLNRARQRKKGDQRPSQGRTDRPPLGMGDSKRDKFARKLSMNLLQCLAFCVPGAKRAAFAEFHKEIARRVHDPTIRFFNVVAPRGHAKSTIVVVAIVIWHIWLEDIFHWVQGRRDTAEHTPKFVVIVSKTEGEAKSRLRALRYVLGDLKAGKQSIPFLKLFGQWGESTAIKWSENMLILKDGTRVQAMGTGQQGRGLNEDNLRPTLVTVDDPEDETNTATPEAETKNIRWLFQSVLGGLDPQRGRLVVIGTPITTTCMVVSLHRSIVTGKSASAGIEEDELRDAGRRTSLWFKNAEADNLSRWSVDPLGDLSYYDEEGGDVIEEDDDGQRWVVKRGVLWPEWCSRAWLRAKRRWCEETDGVGLGVYYREFECEVVGNEEQEFTPDLFSWTYEGELMKDDLGMPYLHVTHRRGQLLDEPERIPVGVSTGIDLAFSVSATADKTAIVNGACAIGPDGLEEMYELPSIHKKFHSAYLLDAIEENHNDIGPQRGLIEANGPQVYIAEQLRSERGIFYVLERHVSKKKKGEGSRIGSLHNWMRPRTLRTDTATGMREVERTRFWHRVGSPLKSQLKNYPRGRDDFADATEKMVRARSRPRHDEVLVGLSEQVIEQMKAPVPTRNWKLA